MFGHVKMGPCSRGKTWLQGRIIVVRVPGGFGTGYTRSRNTCSGAAFIGAYAMVGYVTCVVQRRENLLKALCISAVFRVFIEYRRGGHILCCRKRSQKQSLFIFAVNGK
jgi:hypothetical protein